MAIMATTFSALAMNLIFLREQGVLKRMRGTPLPDGRLPRRRLRQRGDERGRSRSRSSCSPGSSFFGIGWPKDWLELVVFVVAGVVCLASLGVAWSHVIPNFDAAPAYTNIVFLPVIFISGVFYDVGNAPQFLRDIAQALPLIHVIDGLSAAMVTGDGARPTTCRTSLVIALWAALGIVFAVRGFSWDASADLRTAGRVRNAAGGAPSTVDRHPGQLALRPLVAQQPEDVDVEVARRRGGASRAARPRGASRRRAARACERTFSGFEYEPSAVQAEHVEARGGRRAPWTRGWPRCPRSAARTTCRPSPAGRARSAPTAR